MGSAGTGGSDVRDGTLSLRVLGPTALERDGEPLAIGGKRQRAVLVRLALAEGRLVTVERLVEDLWGEDAQPSILTTLHGYVSRLRSALQEPSRLRREGPGYVLDLGPDEMDARTFERLAGLGRATLDDDPATALGHLERALALWRGPAYVDVLDLDWAAVAATRLEELRLGTLEARFDALLALGRHVAVLPEIEEALTAHPLRERFCAQLMLALYRAGRQADALRVFERTRRHLVDELGLDPSPDLVKLESAILGHEDWLAAPSVPGGAPTRTAEERRERVGGASPVALPPAAERQLHRPFVGRDAEVAALAEAWEHTLDGDRKLVIVEGEAGAGKSRLAAQFASIAHARGAIVLWGRATSEAIVPYEPMVEALRTVLHTISGEARHRVLDGRTGLSLLLPFVADPDAREQLADADEARAELGADRYVMFETLAELLDAESAVWPLVFVLDDLHWADALSLRLLQHLLQHERPARLLVIATLRTVPAVTTPHLESFMTELQRAGALTRVSLGGLDEHEVAELLDASDSILATRASAIHRATHGNPFFVTELAEHGDTATLPASVRDVLGARLAKVPPSASRLLAVAAVAGPSASLPVLSTATGLDSDELIDAIDASLEVGLLAEDEVTGSLTFRHGLVQQVVLERLSRTRRRTIHLDVADALEGAGATQLEVAHHLIEAGALVPGERTVMSAVRAGRETLAVLAYEEGLRWAQAALDVPGQLGPACRCEALLLRSDAQRALGDRTAARAAAGEAADEARRTGDPLLLARAAEAMALARAGIGFDFGTEDEGLDELLREALNGLPATEVAHRSRLLGASLSNAAADGDLLALRGLSQEALALAEANGQQTLIATAHLAARMSNWKVDMLDQRLAADRAAWDAALRSGSTHLQLNALLYGIVDLTESGRAEEGLEWLERFRIRAAEVRQPVYDAFVGFLDATLALMRGEYERSAHLADEALLRGLQSHGVNAEQAWSGQAFVRAWDRGELAGMLDLVEQAASRPPHLPIWRVALGTCLAAAGRPDEAAPILAEVVTEEHGIRHNPDSLYLAMGALLVEIAREVGDRERAAILLRELEPYHGRLIVTGLGRASLGPSDRIIGVAAHLVGDYDKADHHLTASADLCRRIGAVPHYARSLFDRATLLDERDGHGGEEAENLRARAEKLAGRIGLVLGSLGAACAR